MTQTLQIELDSSLFLGLHKDQESMAAEMRLAAAVKWYECAMLTQERAASVAGLSRADFLAALSRYKVSPFQETPAEIRSVIE